ncbi:MAG: hypothetical protein M0Z39_08745, partial [Actinomycetota bacterium]|nr:hypothetical protein [Actinomycetota bacterium]
MAGRLFADGRSRWRGNSGSSEHKGEPAVSHRLYERALSPLGNVHGLSTLATASPKCEAMLGGSRRDLP